MSLRFQRLVLILITLVILGAAVLLILFNTKKNIVFFYTPTELIGKKIAERTIQKGIKDVAFDKGKYKYHGLIRILADSARSKGLNFWGNIYDW